MKIKVDRNLTDIRLATKCLRILSLGGNNKVCNHLVANLISAKFLRILSLVLLNIGLGLIFNRFTQIEYYFLYFTSSYKTSQHTEYT